MRELSLVCAKCLEEQLGGRVEWNQLGMGWKGFVPRRDGGRQVFNAARGLPESGRGEL